MTGDHLPTPRGSRDRAGGSAPTAVRSSKVQRPLDSRHRSIQRRQSEAGAEEHASREPDWTGNTASEEQTPNLVLSIPPKGESGPRPRGTNPEQGTTGLGVGGGQGWAVRAARTRGHSGQEGRGAALSHLPLATRLPQAGWESAEAECSSRAGRSSGCGIGCKCRIQSATAVPGARVHVVDAGEKEQHRNKSKTEESPRQREPACAQTRRRPRQQHRSAERGVGSSPLPLCPPPALSSPSPPPRVGPLCA